jgi:hypothetical protein
MAGKNIQETLDRILEDLSSNESARCQAAIHELETLKASSPAILRELERLAVQHTDPQVREHASQSLGISVHRLVRSNINKLNRGDRSFILKQLEQWQVDGLIEANSANVIRRRYDFDIAARPSLQQPVPVTEKAIEAAPAPAQPVPPAGPPPSLTQTLLSEASIKVYLYLGAFFVIAAALILAALVEAARLPILAVATLAFGGTSLLLLRRLPQPSFALFIVFSFLLPIDANVLEETLDLREPALSVYWTAIFLSMAAIWGFSVWFYESKFFSAVAFISLSLAFYRAAEIFDTQLELRIFLGALASLAGLGGTWALSKWKGREFSLPVFWLAQVQMLGLLVISFGFAVLQVLGLGLPSWWLLMTATWILAAAFYVLSDILIPFVFFPRMATATLLPIPWLFLNAFDVQTPAYALGFWGWGSVIALVSEAASRSSSESIKKYAMPLLEASAVSFLAAFAIAFIWDRPALSLAIFALTALVYTALHLLRARWYIWGAALLSALLAYFTFFQLPTIQRLDVPLVYQFLIVTILLVVPELFAKSPLSLRSEWRAPAIGFGILAAGYGITLALIDFDHTGRSAVALIVYAVLFTLHALHTRQEWLGYLAAASASLALLYALDHFDLDLWLPALYILLALYYAAGLFFRRRIDIKLWGNVLINSGLVLGALFSIGSLVLAKETSGWYILLIAFLYTVEIFARPLVWLELAVETLLSIALYLILDDLGGTHISHFLFGASLIWLGGDLVFGRLITRKRVYRPAVLLAGSLLVLMSTSTILGELDALAPTIYFAVYAAFFAMYALLLNKAQIGYIATAFLALTVFKFCDLLDLEKWIFPLILLALLYYAAGFWRRQHQATYGWDEVLLYSGLGLGVLTSIGAPLQEGLDASIPVAIAATLFAAEAFAQRNVWWAIPANMLYLMAYFMILLELEVDEPQFYSVGAALLGMLMHNLLTRAGSKTSAFIAGMLSQFVLLGTTYIQMVSTERLLFFFVLFAQSMLVLIYGLVQRSRSLVITPIAFAVIGVVTVVYSALKGLGPVILIGSTGLVLLLAGIVAVLLRERITRLGEQLSGWKP